MPRAASSLTVATSETDLQVDTMFREMENVLVSKNKKRLKRTAELQGKVIKRIRCQLRDVSEESETTQSEALQRLKERIKSLKLCSDELANAERKLCDHNTEVGNCIKVIRNLRTTQSEISAKYTELCDRYRTKNIESLRTLKHSIERVLHSSIDDLAKTFEPTQPMRKMKEFIDRLES